MMPANDIIDNIKPGLRNAADCQPVKELPVGKINILPEASFPHRSMILTSSRMSLSLRLRLQIQRLLEPSLEVNVTDFKPESSELPDMKTDHFDPSSLSFSSGLITGGFSSPNISSLIFFS